ncbi:ABC transporter permease [Candidatus Bathyarchaeota archaeon]|nr:MAG: ABC transporter permease [Candidatus Bathyarchaeota archaeon]
MRGLRPLVEKEVKDLLRDPRIYIGLIIPIIMFPIIGFAISMTTSQAMEAAREKITVTIIDEDRTEASERFISLLSDSGLNVTVSAKSLDEAIKSADKLGSKALLVIHRGFEESLKRFGRVNIEIYSVIRSMGFKSMGVQAAVSNVLKRTSEVLSSTLISRVAPDVDPEVLRNPLNVTEYSVVKGKIIHAPSGSIFGQLMIGHGVLVPMILFVLSMTVTQIAATATAVENEEKTLETLLTFPVSRYDILLAKLLGSSVVAALGGVIFAAGFVLYFQTCFSSIGLEFGVGGLLTELPPPPSLSYAILIVSLILAILFVTSLGVVMGALSSDVRIASSLLSVIIIPVLLPSLLIVYGSVDSLPLALQILVYAMPTSYPMIMAKEIILTPMPMQVIYGIPYSAALTLIVLYAASKILTPEKLLTLQYKIKLRRIKKERRWELE